MMSLPKLTRWEFLTQVSERLEAEWVPPTWLEGGEFQVWAPGNTEIKPRCVYSIGDRIQLEIQLPGEWPRIKITPSYASDHRSKYIYHEWDYKLAPEVRPEWEKEDHGLDSILKILGKMPCEVGEDYPWYGFEMPPCVKEHHRRIEEELGWIRVGKGETCFSLTYKDPRDDNVTFQVPLLGLPGFYEDHPEGKKLETKISIKPVTFEQAQKKLGSVRRALDGVELYRRIFQHS